DPGCHHELRHAGGREKARVEEGRQGEEVQEEGGEQEEEEGGRGGGGGGRHHLERWCGQGGETTPPGGVVRSRYVRLRWVTRGCALSRVTVPCRPQLRRPPAAASWRPWLHRVAHGSAVRPCRGGSGHDERPRSSWQMRPSAAVVARAPVRGSRGGSFRSRSSWRMRPSAFIAADASVRVRRGGCVRPRSSWRMRPSAFVAADALVRDF
ncbi:unnamed protein product, partial [Closterium sp. NIES-54]